MFTTPLGIFDYRGHVGESQLLHDYNLSIAELSLTEEILQITPCIRRLESIALADSRVVYARNSCIILC